MALSCLMISQSHCEKAGQDEQPSNNRNDQLTVKGEFSLVAVDAVDYFVTNGVKISG